MSSGSPIAALSSARFRREPLSPYGGAASPPSCADEAAAIPLPLWTGRDWLMYVCLCKAVTDGQVRAAAAAGAREVAEFGLACGAAPGCGGCHRLLAHLLATCPVPICAQEGCSPAA